MDNNFYQKRFEGALGILRAAPCSDVDLRFFAGPVLGAIAFKVYKDAWASDQRAPVTSRGRIFFSVWVTEGSAEEGKLLYNIHALKLREFKGYTIASRGFADEFRRRFMAYRKEWPNVSVAFGPLTLMEGWVPLDEGRLEMDIVGLVRKFEGIVPVVDAVLAGYAK